MNAGVTLAWERCCVTDDYLQRLVWDVNGFSKILFKNRTFFLSFKKDRLHPIQASAVNNCLQHTTARKQEHVRVHVMSLGRLWRGRKFGGGYLD